MGQFNKYSVVVEAESKAEKKYLLGAEKSKQRGGVLGSSG
jgi:hypothetical protein